MADLENSAYQDKVTKKAVAPLTDFLEDVQSRYGLGKAGTRDRFDPYTRDRNSKKHSLGDALNQIQMLREADEDEEELDDIGDVETDGDESSEVDDVETDLEVEPKGTEVTDAEIDNEVDPEEGKIVNGDGETVGNIFIGPGQRYFMGASTDPQMIIVGKISEDYVWFYSFPFKKSEKIKKEIAADLFTTGSNTWLKDPKSKTDEDLRSSIESVLNGRPGENVAVEDYQFSNIQVKYTGELDGDLEPWKELESEFDVIVDSNLTNKQTYNLRMNNKELENFRSELQEKPVADRNFKIIRIVTEERQYMIESAANPTPKADLRALTPDEKDYYGNMLQHNIAAGYGAEGYVAGERVVYDKREWFVLDFVPFGEKMSLVLLDDGYQSIAEYVPVDKISKIDPEDDPKKTKKPKGYCGKDVDGDPVDQTPKSKDLKFPESDIVSGETNDQKALKEETEGEDKTAGVLVGFINKDPELNKNRFTPAIKNLQRKRREGNYDSNLASKAFRVLVDEGARKYFNENDGKLLGDEYSSHQEMFTSSIKDKVAEEFRDQFEANVEMGNLEQEGLDFKIAALVEEAESMVSEQVKEAVPFSQTEINEFKKFDNINVSAENIISYTWDSGNQNFKVEVTKKPRTSQDDLVYSAVSTTGEDEIDEERTKDSESFNTQEDIPVFRDFLITLNLNEDVEKVDTEGLADKEGTTEGDVHPEQLIMGIKIEMEHTKDKAMAKQIALDHLTEIPDYYTRLDKMEKDSEEPKEEIVEADEKKEKKVEPKGQTKEPAHTTTKLVNALPIRGGKKVRTEVIGDVRVRYKTFEEKRKEDKQRQAEAKTKGD